MKKGIEFADLIYDIYYVIYTYTYMYIQSVRKVWKRSNIS